MSRKKEEKCGKNSSHSILENEKELNNMRQVDK
jgi:hypothetical protein